ncbi:MAG: hypothetical protein Q7S95_01705 [bacterium]|nr:hypothetical protein [bacterium]
MREPLSLWNELNATEENPMLIKANRKIAFELFDALLERSTAEPKRFPYDQKDAILPQAHLPDELRRDRRVLACFYFYVCIYMRGGIESLQVFRTLVLMWSERPELFDPHVVEWLSPAQMERVLREYIGWDAKRAGINWVENSRRLVRNWDGNPLNLLAGLRNWSEALRRLRNKRTKRDVRAAGMGGEGFYGFQPKMVSMLLYFYDWEGWLEKRFLYPSPADFHNFRLGLNQGAIVVSPAQSVLRTSEKLSAPWRATVMAYLRLRRADPVEVADALWLFSLVMCGNSPLTVTKTGNGAGLFAQEDLPHVVDDQTFRLPKFRRALERTCLRCPFVERCTLAIPSQPYYRKGLLVLRPRPRMEEVYGVISPDLPMPSASESSVNLHLWEPDS